MSGTSLDGIDLAHITLVRKQHWSFQIHKAETVPYPYNIKKRLSNAMYFSDKEIVRFNEQYTRYLAEVIKTFINTHNISNLIAVCSHGHTVYHQPQNKFTLQIGNLPLLAKLIKQRVICDFRTQDIQFNGQGAPLVPIGDKLLFSNYDYCLNLGGFANISYEKNYKRIAYDICPVNVVLNQYASKLGKEYDESGAFAKAGIIQSSQLKKLNNLKFYAAKSPKSLGIEWVNEHIFHILEEIEHPKDVLATFTEHVAIQIAKQLDDRKSLFITGGGAFNTHLIDSLSNHSDVKIVVPEKCLIENKEALIFAFLGVLRLRNENNCLASVTGANRDHSSGKIYVP